MTRSVHHRIHLDRIPVPVSEPVLRRKGLVERMADSDIIADVRGKGHRATFGRFREEEARKAVRNPNSLRRR